VIAYERDYFYGLVFLDMLPIMLLGMALSKNLDARHWSFAILI
jgi:hypothetical protein